MNDSLELEAATKARPPVDWAAVKSAASEQGAPSDPARATPPAMRVAPRSTSVEDRLRASLPWLFERSSASDVAMLVELASKRLGGLLDDALAAVRSRLGAFASTLEPHLRLSLQDALLTTRLRVDALLPDAIECLSPGELVAILADACATHPHARMHAFRLRRAIDDRHDLSAREAMLDLTADTGDVREALAAMIEQHLLTSLADQPSLPRQLIARLNDREPAYDRQGVRRIEPTASENFAQALGRGDREAAIGLLAGHARVSRATVETALFLRTPRGLLSLAWRAGLDASLSAALQSRLGRIAPDEILRPDAAGTWPMSETEMAWQCRFLSEFRGEGRRSSRLFG